MIKPLIVNAKIDEHVWINIERPNRPTISIDFFPAGGRAVLAVRTAGHSIGSIMCDVQWLNPPKNEKKMLYRYCPMCGEKLNHASSFGHHCKEENLQ